jgi:hypothetical protein
MADEEAIPVSALLLCNDAQVLPVVVPTLDKLSVMKSHYVTSASAVKAMGQNKFNLVVLDLDLVGAASALDRASTEGNFTLAIVLSKHVETLEAAARRHVHFLWKKPVDADLVIRDVKAATGMAKLGRRPAHRVPVDIQCSGSIYVYGKNRALGLVNLTNISSDGFCLKTHEVLPQDATISVIFQLPQDKTAIHATGKVIWGDGQAQAGVHFSFIPAEEREKLQHWLADRTPSQTDLLKQMLTSQTQPASQRGIQT